MSKSLKQKANVIKDNTDSNITVEEQKTDDNHRRSSVIPIPKWLQGPKVQKCWKIFKYVYVIGVIVFGLLLIFLNLIDPIGDWLNRQTEIVLTFLINDKIIYIILVLLLITLLKSIGLKDVLGLRTISVVVLSYRIASTGRYATLFLTMFIIGLLSSFSKLVEYQVIGHELQVVQGTPVKYIFKYIRILLEYCIKDKDKLEWFDPHWTFEISEQSRQDKSMDIINNINILSDMSICCNENNNNDIEEENKVKTMVGRLNNGIEDETEATDDDTKCSYDYKCVFLSIIYFIIAVIWTSVIEWVQPITELFLFAHNWDLSVKSVVIIVLSEFADFDKAVEAMFIITEIYAGKDIIKAKTEGLVAKGVFWALGYCLVMPPTLLWAYFYHKKHLSKTPVDIEVAKELNVKNGMTNGTR